MSQPIVPPARAGVSPSILRRLSRDDAGHGFDVIGDAPPPARQEREQQAPEQPRAAE